MIGTHINEIWTPTKPLTDCDFPAVYPKILMICVGNAPPIPVPNLVQNVVPNAVNSPAALIPVFHSPYSTADSY